MPLALLAGVGRYRPISLAVPLQALQAPKPPHHRPQRAKLETLRPPRLQRVRQERAVGQSSGESRRCVIEVNCTSSNGYRYSNRSRLSRRSIATAYHTTKCRTIRISGFCGIVEQRGAFDWPLVQHNSGLPSFIPGRLFIATVSVPTGAILSHCPGFLWREGSKRRELVSASPPHRKHRHAICNFSRDGFPAAS